MIDKLIGVLFIILIIISSPLAFIKPIINLLNIIKFMFSKRGFTVSFIEDMERVNETRILSTNRLKNVFKELEDTYNEMKKLNDEEQKK